MARYRSENYPEGSAMRAQLEAAEAESAKLEGAVADRVAGRPTARPEQALQMELIRTADGWPMAMLLDREIWPREIVHSVLGDWLYHIPNGGARTAAEAGIFKAMGVRAGVWDLFLMLPVIKTGDILGGLYLELKAGSNDLTINQERFRERALLAGYMVAEVRSGAEFQAVIETYFDEAEHTNAGVR